MSTRGFAFGIGVERIKRQVNVGTLWRSAFNLGADFLFTVGQRYERQSSDVPGTPRYIPLLHFASWDAYAGPFAWTPIAIERVPGAIDLRDFEHPENAVYILGPEDGHLSDEALSRAKHVVSIPSRDCFNVSVAGALVMYDRISKVRDAR